MRRFVGQAVEQMIEITVSITADVFRVVKAWPTNKPSEQQSGSMRRFIRQAIEQMIEMTVSITEDAFRVVKAWRKKDGH